MCIKGTDILICVINRLKIFMNTFREKETR